MISKLKVLQIETTSICNAKCKFCIHSTLPDYGTMSDELFLKILKDATEIDSLATIIPMMLGEPFCDKKFIKRLRLINKILPDKLISVFTNGSLLTPFKIKQLSKVKNLTMHFSLNGTNKETREKLMGLSDFDHVIQMIKLYKQTGRAYKVHIVYHPLVSTAELEAFENLDLNTRLVPYANWSGDKYNSRPQTNCIRAICYMTIMHNGLVNLCCMEHGKAIFGDINKKSVKEIWESTYRQMYCNAHLTSIFLKGPCFNCSKG